MMKAKGRIYETKEGALIDLAVGQEALRHSEAFLFHPTLIDGAGIGSSHFDLRSNDVPAIVL